MKEFKEIFLIKVTLGIKFEILLSKYVVATDEFIGCFYKGEQITVYNNSSIKRENIYNPQYPYLSPREKWKEEDWWHIQLFLEKVIYSISE